MEVGLWLTLPNSECLYLFLDRKKDAYVGVLYFKPNVFNLTPNSHVLSLLNVFLFAFQEHYDPEARWHHSGSAQNGLVTSHVLQPPDIEVQSYLC